MRLCFDAGLGAGFPLRFGGKIGPASGQPVDAHVTVTAFSRMVKLALQAAEELEKAG